MRIERVDTDRGHYYKLDGVRVPGVTTLLNGRPKDGLKYWSAREVAEYVADNLRSVARWRSMDRGALVDDLKSVPWKKRDQAAAKGTEVHQFAEHLISGDPVVVPARLRGHVESCARFLDEWEVIPLQTEIVVASFEHQYCGTIDGAGWLKGLPGMTMWDYKTNGKGDEKNGKGVFPETALQLSGYRYAEVYVTPEGFEVPLSQMEVQRCLAVWIRADSYEVYPVDTSLGTFRQLLRVAQTYRDMKTDKLLIGDPIYPDGGESK